MNIDNIIRAKVIERLKVVGIRVDQNGQATNQEVLRSIYNFTGWDLPSRKRTKEYVFQFYSKHCRSPGPAPSANTAKIPDVVVGKSFDIYRFARQADFYLTQQWRSVRYERLKKSKGACECCGAKPGAKRLGGGTVVLHVDHIKSRNLYPELCLTLSNTQVLCEDCNMGKGAVDKTDWRK